MKARPILFSAPMVQALLDGRKTMTRRIVKKPIIDRNFGCEIAPNEVDSDSICPYGMPGDLLWVRETWKPDMDNECSGSRFKADDAFIVIDNTPEAADKWIEARKPEEQCPELKPPVWRPSIFMPRWASRLTLEITGVRVERLQMINTQDALAEGFPHSDRASPTDGFKNIWFEINGPGSWEKNPWVWVVEFNVHKMNVDAYIWKKGSGK